jgi:hypothetical protein
MTTMTIDTTENGVRIGKVLLDAYTELHRLKEQVESGWDDGTAAAHLGGFALLLQIAGLETTLRAEWDLMRRMASESSR